MSKSQEQQGTEEQKTLFQKTTPKASIGDTEIEDAIKQSSVKLDETTFPPKIDTKLEKEKVFAIVRSLAEAFTISPKEVFYLIFILMLKGASNKGTPDTLSATIIVQGTPVVMTKGDLMGMYKLHCKNNYIRRLAEYLATDISNFAANNQLAGDLYNQISLLVNKGEEPLTSIERSWCNSFNQKNEDCSRLHPRVAALLALEYRIKFQKNKNNSNNTSSNDNNKQKKGKTKKGKKANKK